MKVKINIRDYLEDNAGSGIDVQAHVDADGILEALDLPDEEEFDVDIHEILTENRIIGHLWGIEDVQEVRSDLDDNQAWQVLQTVEERLDSQYGMNRDTIEIIANELFGSKPERRWHGRIDVTIEESDGYGQDEVITRLRDMAELLAKAMPSIQANADEGSVRLVEEARP